MLVINRTQICMIVFYSAITFVVTYYFAAAVQTILHRLFGHHNRVRRVFEVHARGHHAKYPPERLISREWIESEQHVIWYYYLVFLPVAVLVGWASGILIFLAHCSSLGFAIWWHVYLHKHYHLAGTLWERFPWFRRKRELHFIHHRAVHKNYAIVEYWIDSLLGTRKNPANECE